MTKYIDLQQLETTSITDARKALVHPNFIMRIAGIPSSTMQDLHAQEAYDTLVELEETQDWLEQNKQAFCDVLADIIPNIEEKAVSRKAIDVRRSAFNQKYTKAYPVEMFTPYVSEKDAAILAEFAGNVQKLNDLDSVFAEKYEADLTVIRKELKKVFARKPLQNAMMYANTRVYKSLKEYCSGDTQYKAKKERNLLHTLLSYVTRTSTKTSPLSSFTSIALGQWQDKASDSNMSLPLHFESTKIQSVVRIKHALIKALFHAFWNDVTKVGNNFNFKLNESIKVKDDIAFLQHIETRLDANTSVIGNIERSSSIKLNSALKLAFNLFVEADNKTMTLGNLVEQLQKRVNLDSEAKCLGFIQKLVDAQIVVPALNEIEQNDIVEHYISLLNVVDSEQSRDYVEKLRQAQQLIAQYPDADMLRREELKVSIESVFRELDTQLDTHLPENVLSSTFYEDCYHNEQDYNLDISQLGTLYQDLKSLLTITPIFDYNCRLQSIIAQMYIQEFGTDGVCNDPAAFLNAVQDKLNCTGVIWFDYHLSTQFKECIEMDPDAARLEALQRSFMDYVVGEVVKGKDVTISQDWIDKINIDMPKSFTNRGCSHCFFGHIIDADKEDKGYVLNQSYTGHSNFFSRFLENLNDGSMNKIRSYLNKLSRFGDYMELPGVFGFNANLHQQLADKEISIKPHNRNYEQSELVELEDLSLVYDDKTHRVYFSSEAFGKMDVFYFGFLAPIYMPKLYRVLSQAYNQGILSFIVTELMNRNLVKPDGVTYIPRISLGKVVLWRRSWMVPADLLPDTTLDEISYFRAFQQFVVKNDLPESTFIRFTPRVFADSKKESSKSDGKPTPGSFDFTKVKPMYVDFRNPVLVQALRKALQSNIASITMQEVLPSLSDTSTQIANEGYVSELQIELSLEGYKESL